MPVPHLSCEGFSNTTTAAFVTTMSSMHLRRKESLQSHVESSDGRAQVEVRELQIVGTARCRDESTYALRLFLAIVIASKCTWAIICPMATSGDGNLRWDKWGVGNLSGHAYGFRRTSIKTGVRMSSRSLGESAMHASTLRRPRVSSWCASESGDNKRHVNCINPSP